jgi:3-hydroxybutyryl-CoA dehydratase
MVEAYARAARDPNPLHTDSEYAKQTPFGRPIAHGMLVLAFVAEAMASAFGERWASGGTLSVRWRAPASQPLTVTAHAVLRSDVGGVASYDVTCEDETGALLLTGTTSARYEDA